MLLLITLAVVIGICTPRRTDYTAEALGDAITNLPGLDTNTFEKYTMFSGYINVNPSGNRSIFYWFVESLNEPQSDPVALWTNGGPGVSGLWGMFTENGPFRPMQNLSLRVQPWSWVNAASIMFIECPAGVGFSFSTNNADYHTNDDKTAIDNYHFIQGWLDKFPNFKSNDFYITSESYGGHYMPTLSQQIILGNAAGGDPQINFKGVFVGNPYTNNVENNKGQYETYGGHSLVSRAVYADWMSACQDGNVSNSQCSAAKSAFYRDIGNNIDSLAVDFPTCKAMPNYNEIYLFYKHQIEVEGNKNILVPPKIVKMIEYFNKYPDKKYYADPSDGPWDPSATYPLILSIDGFAYDPCEENWLDSWMNQASVQAAIHVLPKHWPGTQISYGGGLPDMTVLWKWIIANSPTPLHLTVVSGDDDSNCGLPGTQYWMDGMGWTVEANNKWKQWTDPNNQVGGYLTKWKNGMNLVTVHSAGHLIPKCQPKRSLDAFKRYLKGEF